MRLAFVILWLSVGVIVVKAQNLIPNPSFEAYVQCPPYPGQIHLAKAWDAPNHQTTDFFHRCAPISSGASVPNNLMGQQTAHSGNGYAGLRTWVPVIEGNPPYREYLTVNLEQPLQPTQKYLLSCWISVAEASSHISDGVGFLFTQYPLPAEAIYTNPPQLRFLQGKPIEERKDWVLFTAIYQALGGEKYLTIGNFLPDSTMLRIAQNKQSPTVYYYIDDVNLSACDSPSGRLTTAIDTFLCYRSSLLLEGFAGALDYRWSNGRRGEELWIETSGKYTLLMDWGCYRTEMQFIVEDRTCNCQLVWPNPFGADGLLGIPLQLEKMELQLYDTSGRLAGTFNGDNWKGLRGWHPSGIFFWKAELHCNGKVYHQSGKVLLIE